MVDQAVLDLTVNNVMVHSKKPPFRSIIGLTFIFCKSGLGRLVQAEEYLSQAQWTVLKMPECSNAFKSRLYRNFGLLNATQGNYQEALRHLADDVSNSYHLVFLRF